MKENSEKNQIAGGAYLFQSHDYRHTAATMFYDDGASMQTVRDYLGHTQEDMTKQYIDYMPKKLDAANVQYFENKNHSLASGIVKGGSTFTENFRRYSPAPISIGKP